MRNSPSTLRARNSQGEGYTLPFYHGRGSFPFNSVKVSGRPTVGRTGPGTTFEPSCGARRHDPFVVTVTPWHARRSDAFPVQFCPYIEVLCPSIRPCSWPGTSAWHRAQQSNSMAKSNSERPSCTQWSVKGATSTYIHQLQSDLRRRAHTIQLHGQSSRELQPR